HRPKRSRRAPRASRAGTDRGAPGRRWTPRRRVRAAHPRSRSRSRPENTTNVVLPRARSRGTHTGVTGQARVGTVSFAASVAAVGMGTAARGAATPEQQYIRTWAAAYREFATTYVRAYRPCLRGATASCGDAQDRAATAALRTASMLSASRPPAALAHDAAQ